MIFNLIFVKMKAFIKLHFHNNFFKLQRKLSHQNLINSLSNPSFIVMKLRDLNHDNKKEWYDHESDIIENIHFFDADQFTDIVFLYGKNDNGSHHLWELLSRKVFDHEFDQYQAEYAYLGFNSSQKAEPFVHTHLFRSLLKTQHETSKKAQALKERLNPL